jgi:hypothetical protein
MRTPAPFAREPAGIFRLALHLLILCTALGTGQARGEAKAVHHDLEVVLNPQDGGLRLTDTITLSEPAAQLEFLLHTGLDIESLVGGHLEARQPLPDQGPWVRYRVRRQPGASSLTLTCAGTIAHRIQGGAPAYDTHVPGTLGLISDTGVYLGPETRWYPDIDGRPVTFELAVEAPEGWVAISQGAGNPAGGPTRRWSWREDHPQEGIWLVAGRYHSYRDDRAQVHLRSPDEGLASRYLEATNEYLDLYSRLIGPYPYAKFALVENFWETGYGMPSFTLLGPRVIRLPFIVRTSYPHEILHNWWGNGVYLDLRRGNWSEGLTTYLADHLLQEREGKGRAYRRRALQRYRDFTDAGRDFPLSAFRARHDGTTQAVGYGKTMMVFHMLRMTHGDAAFVGALRRFWRDNRFRAAGWSEVRRAFEAETGSDLEAWFAQWVERRGAPELAVEAVGVSPRGGDHVLTFDLRQIQPGPPYRLEVPVRVHLATGTTIDRRLSLDSTRSRIELSLPAAPALLEIDPDYDLFRRLHPGEVPASLSGLLGAKTVLMVLPSRAPPDLRSAYEALARTWSRGEPNLRVVWDADLSELPATGAVWILGEENALASAARAAFADRTARTAEGLSVAGEAFSVDDHSVVLAGTRTGGAPIAWLRAHGAEAIPGLARKLPHYGRYGYLVFTGDAPDNVAKGEWTGGVSPMRRVLVGDPLPGAVAERPPLTAVLDRIGPAE